MSVDGWKLSDDSEMFYQPSKKLQEKLRTVRGDGVSERQNFRLNPKYLRIVEQIIQQRIDPRFETKSDFFRYAVAAQLDDLVCNSELYEMIFANKSRVIAAEETAISMAEDADKQKKNIETFRTTIQQYYMNADTTALYNFREQLDTIITSSPEGWYRSQVKGLMDGIREV